MLLRDVVSRSSQNVEQGHGMEMARLLPGARTNDMEQLQKAKYSVFILMSYLELRRDRGAGGCCHVRKERSDK